MAQAENETAIRVDRLEFRVSEGVLRRDVVQNDLRINPEL